MDRRKQTELQRVVSVFKKVTGRSIQPFEWKIIGRQYLSLKHKGYTESQIIYAIHYTARVIPTFEKFGLLSWTIEKAAAEMKSLGLDHKVTPDNRDSQGLLDIGVVDTAPY